MWWPFSKKKQDYRFNKPELVELLKDFVALDIETTGLNPVLNEIIEIAAVRFVNCKETEQFQSLIRPGVSLPSKIVTLTGITDQMVAKSPSMVEVLPRVLNFIGDSMIVAHNSKFDLSFIEAKIGFELENNVFDTLKLSRGVLPHLQNHKLETIVRHFNIDKEINHRALADARATGQVFIRLLQLLDQSQLDIKVITSDPAEHKQPKSRVRTDEVSIPIRLVNFQGEECQNCLKYCTMDEPLLYEMDYLMGKYAVRSSFGTVGYLPASFQPENKKIYQKFTICFEKVETDSKGRLVPYVMLTYEMALS